MIHHHYHNKNNVTASFKFVEMSERQRIVCSGLFFYFTGLFVNHYGDLGVLYKKSGKWLGWLVHVKDRPIVLSEIQDLIYTLKYILHVDKGPRSWLLDKLKKSKHIPENFDLSLPELTSYWMMERDTIEYIIEELDEAHDGKTNHYCNLYDNYTPTVEKLSPIFDAINEDIPTIFPKL